MMMERSLGNAANEAALEEKQIDPDPEMTVRDQGNLMMEFPGFRRWAVVGVSTDRSKYGNKIFRDLLDAGYEVYAVNPKLTQVEEQECYPSIRDLPLVPDVVDVVVPPQAAEQVVLDCLSAGVKRIWFQPGSESDIAIKEAEAGGIAVVANACIMIQKRQWA